ncbi:MAG: DUF2934 domain-containing protein [Pseudomonadota bacterium]
MTDSTVKTRKTARKSVDEAESVKKPAKQASTTATDAKAKAAPKPRQRSATAKTASTTTKSADKPVAAKATRARKTTAKKKSASPEERYQMICTAAYFIAEKRGFEGGYEMNDWIAAEAQIDATLNGQ